MPRPRRICPDGVPLHVLNRGNRRAKVFLEDADYLGFLDALTRAGVRTGVRLLAFCLMPNHFHLVLWPSCGSAVPSYMQTLMNAHIRDLQQRHGTSGTGHIYQGRYRSSAINTEHHLLMVCRYVEANPVAAGMVTRSDTWRWSSLVMNGPPTGERILTPWPVERPADWIEQVNRPLGDRDWRKIRKEMLRSQPAARFLPPAALVG